MKTGGVSQGVFYGKIDEEEEYEEKKSPQQTTSANNYGLADGEDPDD